MNRGTFVGRKKGFILSMDALMAIGLLLTLSFFILSLSFVFPSADLRYHRFYYIGKDMLNVVENMKMSALSDYPNEFPLVQQYLNDGILVEEDLNKTFLDIIGSFWSSTETEGYAKNLTEETLNVLFPSKMSYRIVLGNNIIYEQNITEKNYVARLSTIVSGFERGKPSSGYMARVYITKLNKISSDYIYFGGYEGDGNISKTLNLTTFDSIQEVYMELNAGSNFTLYVNGNSLGEYARGITGEDNMSTDKWMVCNTTYNPTYCSYFVEGKNSITFNFTEYDNSYIGGGYIKIKYDSSNLNQVSADSLGQNATQTYWLPGIDGIINLYSSFYVPGSLNSMDIFLDYVSNYTVYLTIGNATIYESSNPQHVRANITDQAIKNNISSWGLDYGVLSNRTIPIRMGLRNITYVLYSRLGADTFSVTDISGSMDYDSGVSKENVLLCEYECCGWLGCGNDVDPCEVESDAECVDAVCGDCPWYRSTETDYETYNGSINYTKLEVAQDANKAFIDRILNLTNTLVGLTSYATSLSDVHDLSDNKASLFNQIDQYNANGWTCICCGMQEAEDRMIAQSNASRFRAMVVMSDGEANVECTPYNVCSGSQSCIQRSKQDAIDIACDAWNNNNITVYTIGFGSDVDEDTLQSIADCGNGQYYYSNTSELSAVYEDIAEEILNASFVAQTVKVEGNSTTLNTTLFSNSYIRFNYTSVAEEFGYSEISLTFESKRLRDSTGEDLITDNVTGTKEGWYFVPNSTEVIDSKMTSYSSRFWTDRLYVKNEDMPDYERIYWLDDYKMDYTDLGDPFIVQIPVNYVASGKNNSVKIGTSIDPFNFTGGSPDDKVIYTVKIEIGREGYSDVFPKAKGSTQTIWYDKDQDSVPDGSSSVQIGSDPSDIFDPMNDSIDDAFTRLLDSLNFIDDTGDDDGSQTNPIDLEMVSEISFDTLFVSGVPSLWGPSKFEIIVWA
ncbi:MAG: vWA domain-containing protein [Nanoarchaeota archaeon]